jgi:hypothetical protein
MDVLQIKNMGKELEKFLSEFDDCFSVEQSPSRSAGGGGNAL